MMPSWIARVVLLLIASGALVADARPGGGQSSSGGRQPALPRGAA
jgi:hypothetical protein